MRKILFLSLFSLSTVFLVGCGVKTTTSVLFEGEKSYLEWSSYSPIDSSADYEIMLMDILRDDYDRKIVYKTYVSSGVNSGNIDETIYAIINEITQKDKDVDEAIIRLYSEKAGVNGPYDIGNAIRAPGGSLGNVTTDIGTKNRRDGYRILFKVKDNLQDFFNIKFMEETVVGLSTAERKEAFKDLISAEDRANADADKKYDLTLGTQKEITKIYDIRQEYYKIQKMKYVKEYTNKWGITSQELEEIGNEGVKKYWPFE